VEYDVVVVGAGVIGGSIAFHLARLGVRRVALVERRHVAWGASGRSGALVRTHYTNVPEARLALAAQPWFEEWADRVGGSCGFQRTGFVQLVAPADSARLRDNVDRLRRDVGVETEVLDAAGLRLLAPYLRVGDGELGAYEPRSGYADPEATTRALAAAAEGLGVTLVEGCEVTRIAVEGGRVRGVETGAGRLGCSVVVVAGGNWSRSLLGPIGVSVPIHPTRVQVVRFERPTSLPGGARGHLTVIDRRHGYYARPAGETETLVGLSGAHRPLPDLDDFPRENDAEFVELARAQLARRIPAFAGARYAGGHMGPLDVTDDGKAVLGWAPGVEGLVLAVGMSGTGFKKAPAIGACLAELVTRGAAETAPIEPFRPGRFGEGRPLTGDEYELPPETIDGEGTGALLGRGLIH
jgi:sarcosine oxidase, subunit beta